MKKWFLCVIVCLSFFNCQNAIDKKNLKIGLSCAIISILLKTSNQWLPENLNFETHSLNEIKNGKKTEISIKATDFLNRIGNISGVFAILILGNQLLNINS